MTDTEAVVERRSVKNVFLKISQNSQKKQMSRSLFLIKLQAVELQLYPKEKTSAQASPVNFAKF